MSTTKLVILTLGLLIVFNQCTDSKKRTSKTEVNTKQVEIKKKPAAKKKIQKLRKKSHQLYSMTKMRFLSFLSIKKKIQKIKSVSQHALEILIFNSIKTPLITEQILYISQKKNISTEVLFIE